MQKLARSVKVLDTKVYQSKIHIFINLIFRAEYYIAKVAHNKFIKFAFENTSNIRARLRCMN